MNDELFLGETKIRCPRCRGQDLVAYETTEASMSFEIKGGRINRIMHSDEFGCIVGVDLHCNNCKHDWKPRRVHQVTDLAVPGSWPPVKTGGEEPPPQS